jgi:hypothetical protein
MKHSQKRKRERQKVKMKARNRKKKHSARSPGISVSHTGVAIMLSFFGVTVETFLGVASAAP